jgi:hypothetical protein
MNQQSPMAPNGPKQFHASFLTPAHRHERTFGSLLASLRRWIGAAAERRPVMSIVGVSTPRR